MKRLTNRLASLLVVPALGACAQVKRPAVPPPSAMDELLYEPSYVSFKALNVRSQTTIASFVEATGRFGPDLGTAGVWLRLTGSSLRSGDASNSYAEGLAGLELESGGRKLIAAPGYRHVERGPLLASAGLLQASGAVGWLDFGLLRVEPAVPAFASQALIDAGVSDTRVTYYFEKALASWVDATAAGSFRSVHLGRDLSRGAAAESMWKLGCGPPGYRLRAGPFVNLWRFDAEDDALRAMLPRRYSYIGPFATAVLGPGGIGHLRAVLSVGYGVDRSLPADQDAATFTEMTLESRVNESVAARLGFFKYTADLLARPDRGTTVLLAEVMARI